MSPAVAEKAGKGRVFRSEFEPRMDTDKHGYKKVFTRRREAWSVSIRVDPWFRSKRLERRQTRSSSAERRTIVDAFALIGSWAA